MKFLLKKPSITFDKICDLSSISTYRFMTLSSGLNLFEVEINSFMLSLIMLITQKQLAQFLMMHLLH